ncbi:MAG: cohesin domain-containing protein [bacterium]
MDNLNSLKKNANASSEMRIILAQVASSGSSFASSVDAVSKPTFPYGGPFEIPATTSVAASSVNLTLASDSQNPKIGDTFKVSITISSGQTSIKSYKVQLTYDKSLVDVIDSDSTVSGTQLKVIDTFFTVKTNTINSTSGVVTLEATTSNANTVNRKVAEISFKAKTAGTFVITKDSSNTIAISTTDTSVPLNYQSLSLVLGTSSSQASSITGSTETIASVAASSQTTSKLPGTAMSADTVSILATVFAATLLIVLGFSATIRSRKSSLEE